MFRTSTFANLLLGGLIVLLTGCATQYEFTPPVSESGKQCVQQCLITQNDCRNVEQQRAAIATQQCEATAALQFHHCEASAYSAYASCQQAANVEYTTCLMHAPDRKACIKRNCIKRTCFQPSCYRTADYDRCESDFRLCYSNCGGTVNIVK